MSKEVNEMAMNLKRFKALVRSYGAEPSRWPAEERGAALALLEVDPRAAALLKTESRLDALLADLPQPKPAESALLKRLATIPFGAAAVGASDRPTTFGVFMRGFFPARQFAPQGAGLVAACILGLWLGLAVNGGAGKTVYELDPGKYFVDNPDLDRNLEDLR